MLSFSLSLSTWPLTLTEARSLSSTRTGSCLSSSSCSPSVHCHHHHHLNRHLNRPSWSIRSLKISKVTQTEWVQATYTMWILCGGGGIPQVPWISILRNCSWFHKADSSVRFCLSSDRSTASHCSPSTCFGPPPPACFVPWWITSPPCCTPLPP